MTSRMDKAAKNSSMGLSTLVDSKKACFMVKENTNSCTTSKNMKVNGLGMRLKVVELRRLTGVR